MIITARAKFPPVREAAEQMLERVRREIREAADRYNATEHAATRTAEAAKIAELQEREQALVRHIGQLADDAKADRASKAKPRKRPAMPRRVDLPAKPRALLAAEKAVADAVSKVDAAGDAIRKFAQTEHRDTAKAGKQSIGLEAVRRAAVQEHLAASIKLAAEREAWHRQCDEFLKAAFQERKTEIFDLVNRLEIELWQLRHAAVKKIHELRRALRP
jgi:hypothetical protein